MKKREGVDWGMAWKNRLRAYGRWGLTGASFLILALAVASGWWDAVLVGSRMTIGIESGRLGLSFSNPYNDPEGFDSSKSIEPHWECSFSRPMPDGPAWEPFLIPLWAPFLCTALPAGLLWRGHIRRRPLYICKSCNYDRRGLASACAACPECGAVPQE